MAKETIKELLDKIVKAKIIHQISLNDYPSSTPFAQMITERVDAIIYSLEVFNGYVKDSELKKIIKGIWSYPVTGKGSLIKHIGEIRLITPLNKKNDSNGAVSCLKELIDDNKEIEDNNNLIDSYKKSLCIIDVSFELFNAMWSVVKSANNINLDGDSITIKKLMNWMNVLLPRCPITTHEQVDLVPHWNELCTKIENCLNSGHKKCCCWHIIIPALAIVALVVILCFTIGKWGTMINVDISSGNKWLHYIFCLLGILAILSALILAAILAICNSAEKAE